MVVGEVGAFYNICHKNTYYLDRLYIFKLYVLWRPVCLRLASSSTEKLCRMQISAPADLSEGEFVFLAAMHQQRPDRHWREVAPKMGACRCR